jgi:uncharacterized membrane protein
MENPAMKSHKSSAWAKLKNSVRRRLLSGIFLLMPLGVTLLVMRWLFRWVARFLRPIITFVLSKLSRVPVIESVPDIYITVPVTVLSIIVLLTLLYLVGAIGQFVVGKRLIKAGETLLMRIPLVRTVYTATKQVAQAVSLPDSAALKSVVLVEFPRPGFKAVGFLTGYIEDSAGKKFCKVMIPTTPNPTTGFFELVPAEDIIETTLTVEEAFKMIISGGIVAPDVIKFSITPPGATNTKKENPVS